MRAFRFLLLTACLLAAQLTLASHGIEHALAEHDAACVECLAMPGFAAVPSMPPCLYAPLAAQVMTAGATPPARQPSA